MAAALHQSKAQGAHVRDELWISEHSEAQPLVAAAASAMTFAVGGAVLPIATTALVPEASISLRVTVLSLMFLAALGAVGANAGGAANGRAALRVTFWGAIAIAITAVVVKLFGAMV